MYKSFERAIYLGFLAFLLAVSEIALAQINPVLVERLGGTDPNGNVLAFSWSPIRDWNAEDITRITGQAIAGPLTSWQTPDGPFIVEHLAGVDGSGNVFVFFWSPRQDWQAVNVSAISSRTLAPGAGLTSWQVPDGPNIVEHLAGVDANGNVIVFFWSPRADWQAVNVSAISGRTLAPHAALTSWQTPDGPFIVEHLAGVDGGGNVFVFFWSPRADWQAVNVSAISGRTLAPGAALTSWQTSDGPFNVEHLGGVDRGGNAFVFFWSPRADWQAVNVSAISGRTLAAGAALTSWQTPDGPFIVEHLAGMASNGDLFVFFWSPRQDWQAVNVSNIAGQQKISGALTSWQTPNGPFNVEHLAAMSPNGDVLVFFWSPEHDWQVVNVSNIAGRQKIASALTSWQTRISNPRHDVLTQHNNMSRTGAYLTETRLTPSNVAPGRFGRLYSRDVEGDILAQPLYVRGVHTSTHGTKNLVFVATAKNMVYAFDADETNLDPRAGLVFSRRLQPTADVAICDETKSHRVGITGAPVIDANTNTMYVVARSGSDGQYYLHALNIADRFNDRLQPVRIAGVDPRNSNVVFDARCERDRPGLLLLNGVVYVGFATFSCDAGCPNAPYHGWIFGYKASDLSQVAVFDTSPSGGQAGVWQSGNGLVGSPDGTIYFETGNGPTSEPLQDSFVKLKPAAPPVGLTLAGSFSPNDAGTLSNGDTDLGSGGPMLLPHGLLIGGGKQGRYYVLDQGSMTLTQDSALDPLGYNGFQAFINTHHNDSTRPSCPAAGGAAGCDPTFASHACFIHPQRYANGELCGPNIHGGPIFWEANTSYGLIYEMPEKDYLKAFKYDLAMRRVTPFMTASDRTVAGTVVQGRPVDGMPGGASSLSANGTHDGIVWTALPLVDAQWINGPGRLVAFDASNLQQLWFDDGGVDFAKFTPPTIADGKVYRATFSDQIIVYGSLSQGATREKPASETISPAAAPEIVESGACVSINQKYKNYGRDSGLLGVPTTHETPLHDAAGGAYQHYRGVILSSISMLSAELPPTAEIPTCSNPPKPGQGMPVESSIYWSPKTCAHVVSGEVRNLWIKLGAQASKLGYPISDQTITPDGRGAFTRFEYGEVWWYPGKGAYVLAEEKH
jgi:hypothetical protein